MEFYMNNRMLLLFMSLLMPVISWAEDPNKYIDVSTSNPYGITIEWMKNEEVLIKVPKEFNGVAYTSAYFLYKDRDDESEQYLSVPLKHFSREDHELLFFKAGREAARDLQVNIMYKPPEMLCIEAVFQLSGFAELEYSEHWRQRDIVNFFEDLQKLKRGMTEQQVSQLIRSPWYESSHQPRTSEKADFGYYKKYILLKDPGDRSKDQTVTLNFNHDWELIGISTKHIDHSLMTSMGLGD
jgi:hypothetical protein